jgi:phage terminase large subunit-like protein
VNVDGVNPALLASYEEWAPHIAGNPYIPHWPTPKQWAFLGAGIGEQKGVDNPEVHEALYGGAAGGGKSDALLMAVAQYAWPHPEFSAACFRRTAQDLMNPGALLDRAMAWWLPTGVVWNGTKSIFTFPNGAKVKMGHMSQPEAHLDHQGAEYHCTVWDELTQHPTSKQYTFVGLSRVRRLHNCKIPLRTLCGSNPGGPGHVWVKERFITGFSDLETGRWVDPRLYVPATLDDNPFLDRAAYTRTLMHFHPTLRKQLLRGDWDVREPGDYFRAIWFGRFLDSVEDAVDANDKHVVRWWDLAASEDEHASKTAGVKMARLRSGVRTIEHAVSFRLTPGARNARIAQIAVADGPEVVQGFEVEPGSGGIAQVLDLEKLMKTIGRRSTYKRPKVEMPALEGKLLVVNPLAERGKTGRAIPVAACLERGHQRRGECGDTGEPWWGKDEGRGLESQRDGLRIYAGPWLQSYLDAVEGFPGAGLDEGDATSAAWAYLEAHPFGLRIPFEPPERKAAASDSHDAHPDEEDDEGRRDEGQDWAGRWTP